jgi:HK97 gp10 family phage protein
VAVEDIKGLRELQQALDQLPEKLERNIMRGAMRAGAKVFLDEAKQHVPVASGDLRDSLRISTSVKGGVVKAAVKAGNAKAWYARLVEFGTAAHFIKPKNRKSLFLAGLFREVVNHPGAQKKPFMRVALDAGWVAAANAVADYIRKRLTKQGINTPSE